MAVTLSCEICAKEYKVKPYIFKNKRTRFCSSDCRIYWMKTFHIPWNKGLNKELAPQLSNSGTKCGHVPWNKGLKLPETSGINSPRWIDDRTKLSRFTNGNEYRNSPISQDWTKRVKNRDGWKCRIANQNCSGRMEAHHILSWKDHPELRYEVNNGITLCHAHHPRARAEEVRLAPFFQEILTSNGK